MFTGDRSGDFLYLALYKAGFANQAHSTNKEDELTLINCFISSLVRCAPPANKPSKEEFSNCQPYLEKEFQLLINKRVMLCLGQLSYTHVLRMLKTNGYGVLRPRLKFHHGLELEINPKLRLITSYHSSQQNTFTGKLTEKMFDEVFDRIKKIM
jgi:uracil-DNA glycosylase family 4